ncbi:uncharacterized protein LOC107304352 [Oryza brachyantha]|uniref:uncharacterized protein LOC107304352 n=1 Tax=Oryza brachyantha TaxID=4533 RepID=UPI00077682A0|nr:uncharacterized protein LOC107304352 [Oryza brachyantha]
MYLLVAAIPVGRCGFQRMVSLYKVSVWLNNSIDPFESVSRKGETYWTQVAKTYNKTIPDGRKRDVDSLKGHYHKITNKVTLFNVCHGASGRSDAQLMEHAMELYNSRSNRKTFGFVHLWMLKVVVERKEAKLIKARNTAMDTFPQMLQVDTFNTESWADSHLLDQL